ncbi:ferric reductase like transmembrane component-domain-containing protein [Thelonectria olida]|uniref:Ferric reductase like transmembrane component-domain-containing protein n=1 Tax=Thelonectria olida TaxID=1576542 RepID=A0A9P8VZ93_9HYPO|nr:ferric reductase like transmembrane component-domain-containing protein [Thelonectria olida]
MRLQLSSRAALLSLCIAILSINQAAAAPESPARVCFNACQTALAPLLFDDMLWNQTRLNKTCHSARGLSSLYLCLDVYCMPEARSAGLGPLNKTCQESAFTAIPPFDVISNYTREDRDRLRRVELEEAKKPHTWNEVVLPSEAYFGVWWDTLDSVAYVNYWHYHYGASMIIFWAVVVAIGVVSHVVSAVSNSQLMKPSPSRPSGAFSSFSSWFTGTFTLPATSLTLVAFLLVNIVFSVIGYRIVPVNLYFDTKFRQVLRYGSDRTGIISFANFPLIWLFGMRNNVLMWLTGWDFGTYNNFHRWVARIATVQAIIHSVGYSMLVTAEGGWSGYLYWYTYMFWWTGVLATIFMSLLLLFSFYWIRRQQYELFLIIHIVLSIIVLVTMFLHVSIFDGEYDLLFWIPLFIWFSDRLLRTLRIVAFNPYFWNTRASASYNPSSNIVRLAVPCASSVYKPQPGTYYYLHVLNGPRCWESHPFTVAAVLDPANQTSTKLLGEQVPLLEPGEPDPSSTDTLETQSLLDASDPSSMTFLILLVDGPYGHTQPFHLFTTVVFVVGGSGIVVPLSYLQALTTSSVVPRSVQIHWAVREPQFALDVLQTDVGDALGSPNLSVKIYLTQYTHDSLADFPSQVTLQSGRIDAPSVIASALESADSESLAVVACGPAQMADAARKTVAGMKRNGATGIEYFEEKFEW